MSLNASSDIDLGAGDLSDDLGDVADAVVLVGVADVEGLVVDDSAISLQQTQNARRCPRCARGAATTSRRSSGTPRPS
jgi:hypothetical protein